MPVVVLSVADDSGGIVRNNMLRRAASSLARGAGKPPLSGVKVLELEGLVCLLLLVWTGPPKLFEFRSNAPLASVQVLSDPCIADLLFCGISETRPRLSLHTAP